MGNNCNYILRRDSNLEVNTEKKKSYEKDANILIRYLMRVKTLKRTEFHREMITNKAQTIFQQFELIKEEEIKELIEFQKTFLDVFKRSKRKFQRLKLDYFAIFDIDSLVDIDGKLLRNAKDLVCNYLCYKVTENENLRKSYSTLDPLSIINSLRPNIPSYLATEMFFLNYDQNIYENIFNLLDLRAEGNTILNNFLIRSDKKLNKSFYKTIMKYLKLYLMVKGNYSQTKDKYLKLNKSKIQELKSVLKDRCVGDVTIEEDFQEKLRFILNKIAPKKELGKGRTTNERLTTTSPGTNDSFQNGTNLNTFKKGANEVFRKTMFKLENKKEDFEKMPMELNNILQTESPDKSSNTSHSFLQYQPTLKKNLNQGLKKIEVRDKNNNKVYSTLQHKSILNTMKLNIDITCYYMGEMDNYNYSYSGIGKLFKPEYYFYKGTFYNGKKEGYGYTFKQEKSGNYFYYIGEWENNLPHGFGISYIYPKEVKKGAVRQKKLQRGKFNKGKFEAGIDLTIKEEETQILAEKYVGVIENDSYKSGEKIYRTLYKIENQEKGFDKAKVEVDYHYYYQGHFKGKLEHGKGMSVKTFPGLNYRYYYKGDFENGQMNGEGTIIFEGNFFVRKYEGLFEKDKWFCHFGKVYFKSGDIYQGFFDSNNSKDICGYYLHTNNDESKLRELEKKQSLKKFNDVKEFTDNEFESMKNFITHSNIGDVFFGEFHNDKKHGLGKYLFKSEKMLAVGRYLDGERNGKFDTAKNEALDERRETQFFGTAIHNAPVKKNIQSKTASKWVKRKKYYLIENDEIIDDSDKPF